MVANIVIELSSGHWTEKTAMRHRKPLGASSFLKKGYQQMQYLYLPINGYRPEEMRVIGTHKENSTPNVEGQFTLEVRRPAGEWLCQGEYTQLETAIHDALQWYYWTSGLLVGRNRR